MKLYRWLMPASCLYGAVMRVRNFLFDKQILLRSESFRVPVIGIGNLTVGGTGKTPHTEYLIRLLLPHYRTAVVSRGYKRKTKGYLLASSQMNAQDIGDEPCQMKHKFPQIILAVCARRCEAIHHLLDDHAVASPQVILLDDAYQHRYVKPGLQILLTTHDRLISSDLMLPAGLLREPFSGRKRAHIVIVTKCPPQVSKDQVRASLRLEPHQQLFFTRQHYSHLRKAFSSATCPLHSLQDRPSLILFSAIANTQSLQHFLSSYCSQVLSVTFADHHFFSPQDFASLEHTLLEQPASSVIITTEKDEARLQACKDLIPPVVLECLYVIPMEIEFDGDEATLFNQIIMNYVTENQ